jgi:hypothetical protein
MQDETIFVNEYHLIVTVGISRASRQTARVDMKNNGKRTEGTVQN